MQEKSSHKAMMQPVAHKAKESEREKSSFWFPGDETHGPVYIDAFSQEEADAEYEKYLAR